MSSFAGHSSDGINGHAHFGQNAITGSACMRQGPISGHAHFRQNAITGSACMRHWRISGHAHLGQNAITGSACMRQGPISGSACIRQGAISGRDMQMNATFLSAQTSGCLVPNPFCPHLAGVNGAVPWPQLLPGLARRSRGLDQVLLAALLQAWLGTESPKSQLQNPKPQLQNQNPKLKISKTPNPKLQNPKSTIPNPNSKDLKSQKFRFNIKTL